jgi:hypothetical protein
MEGLKGGRRVRPKNLTAFYGPIVYEMWSLTASYSDSFTSILSFSLFYDTLLFPSCHLFRS